MRSNFRKYLDHIFSQFDAIHRLSILKPTSKRTTMVKMKRKYISEFALNFCSSNWLLIPSSQITSDAKMRKEDAEISKNCHIYLVCERPTVSFDKNDFSYAHGEISGSLIYKIEGVEHKSSFCKEFPLLDGAVELKLSKYPHREIQTFNAQGECVRFLPASALSLTHEPNVAEHIFRQLKVLYVGQAFGNGTRAAIDRLRNHATLQKILADAHYKSPDSEIMVLTVEYEEYRLITSMDGRAKETINDQRDNDRFISILKNPLKLSQQVSLIEAALIRYFQPQYNKIYRAKFPSPRLKVLAQCYKYDFSALMVEINTNELHFSLFSDVVQPRMHHISNIDLVDHENRASFFHYVDDSGEHIRITQAIGSHQNGGI